MTLIKQANHGAHVAFNRGLELARGELITLINSDDLFLPGRLESLVAALTRNDTAVVASWLQLVDDQGRPLGVKHGWRDMPPWPAPTREPRLSALEDPSLALLETNWIATTSNIAFRKSVARELRFKSLRYCHDWDFFLGLARCGRLALLEQASVCYRVHAGNTLREGRDQGRAQMELEILWLLVAHGRPLLTREDHLQSPTQSDLKTRFWAGLPRFGNSGILPQLLALRGSDDRPADAFMNLLEPENPCRLRFLRHWSGGRAS